ncbi:MAG: hypothetical protein QOF06_190 [Solirubrobacterales bacterium]|jgi:hypothetical protein|nr:hypothetical protein [Solirubrobacterales bacterium]
MQTELSFPIAGREDHKAAEDAFIAALEHQIGLLIASADRGDGEAHVVIRQMVARALSDLMVATHLARHGYLSQVGKDFAPSAVRKRLGRQSFDEMYSHYSELAHPRFQGSRFNTFGKREEGKERLQLLVTVGPTMLEMNSG